MLFPKNKKTAYNSTYYNQHLINIMFNDVDYHDIKCKAYKEV